MIKTIIKLTVFSIFIAMLSLSTAMAGGTKPKEEQPDPPKKNPYKKCVKVESYQYLLEKRNPSCKIFLKNDCEIGLIFTFLKVLHLHRNSVVTHVDEVYVEVGGAPGRSISMFLKEYCSPAAWNVDAKNTES